VSSALFVACSGAPRGLGLDQGERFAEAIRDRAARHGARRRPRAVRWLAPWGPGASDGPEGARGVGREIVRHYPHLGERMDGIAIGANLPFDAIVDIFLRETLSWDLGLRADVMAAEVAAVAVSGEGVHGLRSLGAERSWIVRESRPEVGFASLEVTLPWLASAVAGVNEAGVVVAIAPRNALVSGARPRAPSALLLVQECLQRFDDIGGCLDWCGKRPVSGNSALLIGDASGEVGSIEIAGADRRLRRASDGISVAGAQLFHQAELRKALSQSSAPDLGAIASLPAADEEEEEECLPPSGSWVGLDSQKRALTLLGAGSWSLAPPA